ncbi:MAG TPA: phosphatidylinositol-specific phospholipase C/glycerophosphodiester phosphodiesterase family protein [Verrucomicrobiae bacterium]|nr:phosphatidylinositol-specific phospholipase C/glycerophosphodiester phosphodiesterase family protein [Verrucomicrobiae bacterium]
MKPAFCLLFCTVWGAYAQPVPLTRVHAHNDYEHKRPLFDALDHGFCSIEADIYLVDGQLLVAHERREVRPERTLQALYLDPLRERVRKNHGRVYADGPEVTLLIDLKTDWKKIYPVLRKVLSDYSDMLVTFQDGTRTTNAILAIITGDRSKAMFDGEQIRYAALDGGLEDLDSKISPDVIPWISSNWYKTFMWRGKGQMDPEEQRKLKSIVDRAHQQHRKVRFWGSPDQPVFWQELLNEDVDLINTDDLAGAQRFLLEHSPPVMK